jgi:hypothetical protein
MLVVLHRRNDLPYLHPAGSNRNHSAFNRRKPTQHSAAQRSAAQRSTLNGKLLIAPMNQGGWRPQMQPRERSDHRGR